MERHLDLEYARIGDRPLCLDLYLPGGKPRPLPVIVWIHGGAWLEGDKSHPRALRLVSEGYAVASIEYRLSQEAIFPAQIHDCKAAVRWLKAHADVYGLAPDRFAAWGESAGAHLASLLGTSAGVPELEGTLGHAEQSSAVAAVCSWYGPSDFLAMDDVSGIEDHAAPDSPESRLVGAPIRTRPDLVARANPITYVTPDAPPFLLMHGTADDVVIANQSELLHTALTRAKTGSSLILLGGLGHGFPGEHGRWAEIYGYVGAFLAAYLKA